MIVYVETNFVLEIALAQEESFAAENILELAEQKKIDLVFPIFALVEPFWTVRHRGQLRRELHGSLREQVDQHRRSDLHTKFVSALDPLLGEMLEIETRETEQLELTTRRMINTGTPIDLNVAHFQRAVQYQDTHDLLLQDAVIYSGIVADLEEQPFDRKKCFVSRNSKDFGTRLIKSELEEYGCRYIATFGDAERYIRNTLA